MSKSYVMFPPELREKYRVEPPASWNDETHTRYAFLSSASEDADDSASLVTVIHAHHGNAFIVFPTGAPNIRVDSIEDAMAYSYGQFLFGDRR